MAYGIYGLRRYGSKRRGRRDRKVDEQDRQNIYARDNNACLKCGSTDNLTIDHVVPVSKGGKNEYSNYQTLCWRCNNKKRDEIADYRINYCPVV